MSDCCSSQEEKPLLCYCFNISKESYQESLYFNKDKAITDFIIFQTKYNYCQCDKLNPNQQCCLKDFKQVKKSFNDSQKPD